MPIDKGAKLKQIKAPDAAAADLPIVTDGAAGIKVGTAGVAAGILPDPSIVSANPESLFASLSPCDDPFGLITE